MTTMTDEADAGYTMAGEAAVQLKKVHPRHELLRLVYEGHDELVARFWDTEIDGELDKVPRAKLCAVTFGRLAVAMYRVLSGPDAPKITIERYRIGLDPSIDVFNVTLEQPKRSGIWKHSAPDQTSLAVFLEGVKAGVACMGAFVSIPEIPRAVARSFHHALDHFEESDIPF